MVYMFHHQQEISCPSKSAAANLCRESIRKITENKVYTAESVFDLLRFVAPELMKRAETHFAHGIAEDLDDPKYARYKYWSNPLETRLPNAPDMEIYRIYGVGITERASDKCKSTPFQIESSAAAEEGSCLKHGVYFVDDDESVPIVSAGFMCAKDGEEEHGSILLGGRGVETGALVDIMGNIALIEDVLKVAAGATGGEIGGDRIFSDILRMSKRINLKL